eukprot:GFYU01003455.1.p1 GENE.GFYU01003455.1~~GFYU01003455.1.p1  ORF type:complete len:322 (-),score=104.21 GFYU01003455.1:152-1117(-)
MSKMDPRLLEVLETTPADSLINPDMELVTLDDRMSMAEAMAVLSERRILSAPVVGANEVVGMVDMLDIVALLCNMMEGVTDENIAEAILDEESGIGRAINETAIGAAVNASRRNPYDPMHLSSPLLDVVKRLCTCHRVPLIDDSFTVVGIVSQSDIASFLERHIQFFEPVAVKTIGDLGADLSPTIVTGVKSLVGETPTITVFQEMIENRVSAFPIVDPEGRLYTNLSATDLQGLIRTEMDRLFRPVIEFRDENPTPIVARLEDTFEQVLVTFNSHRIHRLYIVNDNDEPVGVLSLTDLVKFCGGESEELWQLCIALPWKE